MIGLAAALLFGQASVATDAPPPGLLFGYYRMVAFQARAKDAGCDARPLDDELNGLRKRLAKRWGDKPFKVAKPPSSGAGDCGSVLLVYRVNLADFRRDAEAALAATPRSGS